MNIYTLMTLLGTTLNRRTTAKESETRNLEQFNKINLEGRIELHLQRSSFHSIRVMTKKTADIPNLVTEVRDGELYIYHEKRGVKRKTPKYIIYLNHSGISNITLSGVIKLISDDIISQKDLVINGEGILNGNLNVSVNSISAKINGISNINISGYADVANLKISGIGKINAKSLETNSAKKSEDGFASILLPIN